MSSSDRGSAAPGARLPGRGLRPGGRLGPYTIERELGRGGMGAVFAARAADGRGVAVKVMLDRSATNLRRFEREGAAIQALDHPGIVKLHAELTDHEPPALVMELVDGEGLDARLRARALDREARLDVFEALCDAIQHAHDRGVVHRDLKPQNVLVTRDGRPKVTDFGLARELDRGTRLTATGATIGTPHYMSPEQVEGKKSAGPPADVFSLGVILYELLTDRRPFEGDTAVQVIVAILQGSAARPSRVADVPPALEDACLAALKREPAERPSAGELGRRVRAARRQGRAPPRVPLAALLGSGLALVAAAAALALALAWSPRPPSGPRLAPPAAPAVPPPAPAQTVPPPAPAPPPAGTPAQAAARRLDEARRALAAFDGPAALAALGDDPGPPGWELETHLARARAQDLCLEFDAALATIAQALARVGPTTGEVAAHYELLLLRAALQDPVNDPRPADATYRQAQRVDPLRFEAWARGGLLRLYSGAQPLAREDLRQAAERAPRSAEALTNLATLTWDVGKALAGAERQDALDRALELLRRAEDADPRHAETFSIRAWIHRTEGSAPDREAAAARQALALFEGERTLAAHFARRGRELAAREPARALGVLRRALAENRRHPQATAEIAAVLLDNARMMVRARADAKAVEAAFKNVAGQLTWCWTLNRQYWRTPALRAALLLEPWSGADPRKALTEAELALSLDPPDDERAALAALRDRARGR